MEILLNFEGLGDRLHNELIDSLASDPDPKAQALANQIRVVPNSSYRSVQVFTLLIFILLLLHMSKVPLVLSMNQKYLIS